MVAAVYLRQSLDRHGDQLAVSRQRDDCLALCSTRGWDSPVEYVDNDTSASSGKRPAYQRMLADIAAGKIHAVAVWDLDRLHRRPIELEQFIDLADRHGLALASVGGDADLATDNGRLFARIKGAVSRAEVERKSARQRRSGQQRAERGLPWGPRRPFGYTEDRKGLHPTESRLLIKAFHDVIAGASLNSIAQEWNAAGITTTMGNRWRSAQLHQMMKQPLYAGLRAYNGEIVGKGAWPELVGEDVWRTVVTILTDPSRRAGTTRGRKYLLSGLARCGRDECGEPMGSATATSTGKPVYRCKACQRVSRSIEYTDALVRGIVVERLSRPDALDLLADEDTDDMPALRAEASTLRSRLDDLAIAYADGDMTAGQVRVATKRIEDQLDAVESRMTTGSQAAVLGDVVLGDGEVGDRFDSLSLDRRRAVVDALVTIHILPLGRGSGRVFDPASVEVGART